MGEPRISRVVVGALHQALADHLPLRLDFYEEYLRPMRLREGRVGAASFLAALSFLRREQGAWDLVMARAGRNAADWLFEGFSPVQRAWYRLAPARSRLRRVVRLARDLASDTIPESRGTATFAPGAARLDIRASAFCDVRERAEAPMCRFYGAALERLCELLNVDGRVRWNACRAMGAERCVIVVDTPAAGNGVPGDDRGPH